MGGRAPDLAAAEADVARWFEALPRVAAPLGLPEAEVPVTRTTIALPAFVRPLAIAAAVLVALALPAQGHVTASNECCVRSSPNAQVAVAVVDDPSVPMLHALETFDQLACLTQPDGMRVR